jgi:hypothetical protein
VEKARPVIMHAVPVSGAEHETVARVVKPAPENADASILVIGDPLELGLVQLTVTCVVVLSDGYVSTAFTVTGAKGLVAGVESIA